ncbi:hypothetical protein BDZ45DRAFT_262433 [Acephala macrosclerotiorum]|nr:hypothetical protein BDZ45DRAFT_262433 [Acephala macrosclerotiorum]
MRVTLTTIFSVAVCAVPALAYVAEVFTCIEPEPHCCHYATTTGIGVNCQPALLENVYTMLNISQDDTGSPVDMSAFASACYKTNSTGSTHEKMKVAKTPLCCKSKPSSTTPNMETFDCLPPEMRLFTYNSDTDEISWADDDDTWYDE